MANVTPTIENLLEQAYVRLQEDWDSDDAHKRFLALAEAHQALAVAGKLYRATRDNVPARRASAEKRIDEILGRAMAGLRFAQPAEDLQKQNKILKAVGYVLAVLLIIVSFLMFRALRM